MSDGSGQRRRAAPRWLATALATLAVALVGSAVGAAAPTPVEPPSPAAPTLVQAQTRPVAANVRLMYYASSASVAGARTQFVWREDCDPAVEDCWQDAGGNIVGATVDVPTPAGAGYTQVDVLYVDDAVCVGRVGNHVYDVTMGVLRTVGGSGFVSTDGCLDYWTPAQRLQALSGQGVDGLRVLRGPYTVGGQSFEAVSITSTSQAGVSHNAFDALSGLLVVQSTRTQGAAIPTIGPGGQVQPGAGGSLLTYSQLLGTTTVPGPPQQALPASVAQLRGLSYACSVTVAMQGAPPLQIPCRQEAEVVQRAPGWLMLRVVRQHASMAGLPPEVNEFVDVITAGGVGGAYADPAWLQGLAPGVVVDDDAITGIRVQVGQGDAGSVVISASNPGQRITYVYDRGSGWLRTLVLEQDLGMTSSTTRLDLEAVR